VLNHKETLSVFEKRRLRVAHQRWRHKPLATIVIPFQSQAFPSFFSYFSLSIALFLNQWWRYFVFFSLATIRKRETIVKKRKMKRKLTVEIIPSLGL